MLDRDVETSIHKAFSSSPRSVSCNKVQTWWRVRARAFSLIPFHIRRPLITSIWDAPKHTLTDLLDTEGYVWSLSCRAHVQGHLNPRRSMGGRQGWEPVGDRLPGFLACFAHFQAQMSCSQGVPGTLSTRALFGGTEILSSNLPPQSWFCP